MPAISLSPTRRELLAATAAVGAIGLLPGALRAAGAGDSIRPFTVNIPQEEITELRQRIAATQWPDPRNGCRYVARRAARDYSEARALLGDRLRLAQR